MTIHQNPNARVYASGRTHNVGGRQNTARSADGLLDLKLGRPHPAAENFFGAAWSACFMAAIGLVAAERKVRLPTDPVIDAQIDLKEANGEYFLAAHLDVTLQGVERDVAQGLIERAHEICPYSKATRGNIEVAITLA